MRACMHEPVESRLSMYDPWPIVHAYAIEVFFRLMIACTRNGRGCWDTGSPKKGPQSQPLPCGIRTHAWEKMHLNALDCSFAKTIARYDLVSTKHPQEHLSFFVNRACVEKCSNCGWGESNSVVASHPLEKCRRQLPVGHSKACP